MEMVRSALNLATSKLAVFYLNLPNRNGIFLTSELEDFELFLVRLNRVGGVMQDALAVQNYRSREGWDFHSRFILYCLEHGLQHLLYVYLDHYK